MKTLATRLLPWGFLTGIFVLWSYGCSTEQPSFTEGKHRTATASQNSDSKGLNGDSSPAEQEDVDENGADDSLAEHSGMSSGDISETAADDSKAKTDSEAAGPSDTLASETTKSAAESPDEVASSSEPDVSLKENTRVPPMNNTSVAQYKNDCAMAKSKGLTKTFKQSVFFPAVRECAWSQSGNLSPLDQKIRARSEQYQNIQFPKLSRICGMNFDFPTQTMEFDDEIFLLFDKYVIGSSQNYGAPYQGTSKGFEIDSDGYQIYSWLGDNGLRELYYNHAVTPKHCLPGTTCSLPLTEVEGNMSISIPDTEAIRLGLKSNIKFDRDAEAAALKIGFVTIGDNDKGDCRHLDFRFDITFSYVE